MHELTHLNIRKEFKVTYFSNKIQKFSCADAISLMPTACLSVPTVGMAQHVACAMLIPGQHGHAQAEPAGGKGGQGSQTPL